MKRLKRFIILGLAYYICVTIVLYLLHGPAWLGIVVGLAGAGILKEMMK